MASQTAVPMIAPATASTIPFSVTASDWCDSLSANCPKSNAVACNYETWKAKAIRTSPPSWALAKNK